MKRLTHHRFLIGAAFAASVTLSCSDATAPIHLAPARLDIVSGQEQSAIVGEELVNPLVVRVVDASGGPVSGQLVNFKVLKGGGSVFAGASITNSDGLAKERWTLGTVAADSQVVEARAVDNETGAPLVFGTFRAVARPGAPTSVAATLGATQSATPQTTMADSLMVRVLDRYSNPVPGVQVTWLIPAGAGTLSRAVDTTSAMGYARTQWTTAATVGSYAVTATVAGLPAVSFSGTVVRGPAAQIAVETAPPAASVVGSMTHSVVRILDAFNNPVPDGVVHLRVASGGGRVNPNCETCEMFGVDSDVKAGADGRLDLWWRLGTASGANALELSIGTATRTLAVTTFAAAPDTIAIVAGNAQIAAPGTAVAIDPVVRVVDRYGNPSTGTVVSFATAPSGSVAATATTGTDGRASAGAWVLGSTKGAYSLTATVGALRTVFSASAGWKSPNVGVTFVTPSLNGVVDDPASVRVNVTSVSALASVRAMIGAADVPLARQADGSWLGTVSLTGLGRGPASLLVSATDVQGAVTDASITVMVNRRPTISWSAPADYAVAQPNLAVSVTCQDDDPTGCASLVLTTDTLQSAGPITLLSGTSTLIGTVSLAAFDRHSLRVTVTARDSSWTTTASRTIRVEPSARLMLAATVSKAFDLLDYDGQRVLYRRLSNQGLSMAMVVRDIASGVDNVVPFDTMTMAYTGGFLSPGGAVVIGNNTLLEWRNGAAIATGTTVYAQQLRVSGGCAAYMAGSVLYYRDLASGTELSFGGAETDFDLAPNGDLVFSSGRSLFQVHAGVRITLETDSSSVTRPYRIPHTDGESVTYWHAVSDGGVVLIRRTPDGTLTQLAAEGIRGSAATAGWTAYELPDANRTVGVWLRSPAGLARQVTPTGASGYLVALGDDGTVLYQDNLHTLYLASPGGTIERIGPSQGKVEWRNGHLVQYVDQWVFTIH